jgi:hypothetical protein
MKITVKDDNLEVSGRRGGTIRFSDIAEVESEKVYKITYDEVFLIVREHSGNGVALGELDEGFAEAIHALRVRLPDFPSDWYGAADQAPIGVRAQVWPRRS